MEFLILDIGATLAALVGYVATELWSEPARAARHPRSRGSGRRRAAARR